ncbi:DUF6471 domain-containing protein [Marinomonas posidonica]|uniref:DUF6471 domain-containing protein n=1 Tax=Marinomonas posidonica (strain CECT 7376 / NCIMB 14433 / IVIA-Po-181) TaxID=491952 RepID=F6CVW9_MARPP|nr:DUF6471 domain-containing protein [Marinomonas posidonica]AEF53177.1 hypothetical protein Mar181_0108 [Marinomonas posidonica IVIA-Po-181]
MPKKAPSINQELDNLLVVSKMEWKETLKSWLPAYIKRAGLDHETLSNQLWEQFHVRQKTTNLRSKFSQGTVDGQLLLQILLLCDQQVNLSEISECYERAKIKIQKSKD